MGIIVVMLTGNSLNITGIVVDPSVKAVSLRKVAAMEYSEYTIVVVKLNDVGKVHIHAPTSALKIPSFVRVHK